MIAFLFYINISNETKKSILFRKYTGAMIHKSFALVESVLFFVCFHLTKQMLSFFAY